MLRQITCTIRGRLIFLWLCVLVLALIAPLYAHPGSGTPAYMSIDLYQLTIGNPSPSAPGDIIDTTVRGNSVLMRVMIQHGNMSTVNAVAVSASEQPSGSWTAPLQVLTIDGFTQLSTNTDTTSGIITEIWERNVDTRSNYNTEGWPNTPLSRGSNSFVAQMFNATYDFKPVVTYTINGESLSSDAGLAGTIEIKTVFVINLSIDDVSSNVNEQYVIYNPSSSNSLYQTATVNFSINDISQAGQSYIYWVFFLDNSNTI